MNAREFSELFNSIKNGSKVTNHYRLFDAFGIREDIVPMRGGSLIPMQGLFNIVIDLRGDKSVWNSYLSKSKTRTNSKTKTNSPVKKQNLETTPQGNIKPGNLYQNPVVKNYRIVE